MLMNRRGFGLIEVMVSVAIMSIIMVGATQMITDFNKQVKEVRTLANRDQITELVRHYASSYAAINASATFAGVNSDLRRCISGTGTGTCTGGTRFPFELKNTSGAGPSVGGAATFYSREGALCAPFSDVCPIQVRVGYTARCYGGAPGPCPPNIHAEYLTIDYSITRFAAARGLVFGGSCTTSFPGCPAATAAADVVISIPMFTGLTPGVVNRVPFWNSTTTLLQSTLEVIAASGGNIVVNRTADVTGVANCDLTGVNSGALRTNNGALEVCDGAAGGSGRWKYAGGRMDTSVAAPPVAPNPAHGLPNLPNLFVCPAGGNTTRCGGNTPCLGQVTRQPTVGIAPFAPGPGGAALPLQIGFCCMDRRILISQNPLPVAFVWDGSNTNAACTPLF